MKLLTKAILNKLNSTPLGTYDDTPAHEIPVIVKFFMPAGRYTFYVIEADKIEDDFIMYGFCVSPLGSDYDEMDTASFHEIEDAVGRFNCRMERDRFLSTGYTLYQAMADNSYHGMSSFEF
tara:strand:+ start:3699 stop:4061 length:363 start_codon:yes stop_codon:yes gene_type:complete